jgi:hypothetical protein
VLPPGAQALRQIRLSLRPADQVVQERRHDHRDKGRGRESAGRTAGAAADRAAQGGGIEALREAAGPLSKAMTTEG